MMSSVPSSRERAGLHGWAKMAGGSATVASRQAGGAGTHARRLSRRSLGMTHERWKKTPSGEEPPYIGSAPYFALNAPGFSR